jgi:hypothetical protein
LGRLDPTRDRSHSSQNSDRRSGGLVQYDSIIDDEIYIEEFPETHIKPFIPEKSTGPREGPGGYQILPMPGCSTYPLEISHMAGWKSGIFRCCFRVFLVIKLVVHQFISISRIFYMCFPSNMEMCCAL